MKESTDNRKAVIQQAASSMAIAAKTSADRVCKLIEEGMSPEQCASLLTASAEAAQASVALLQCDAMIESAERQRELHRQLDPRLSNT